MDKNDTMDFFAPSRILRLCRKHNGPRSAADDGEHEIDAELWLPGRGVSADDQRQIQAADRLGPQIAPRVLSRELKALTQNGLIDRKDYGVVPPKVEYRLTRKGRSFIPVISAIRQWGARHLRQADAGVGEKVDSIAAA